MMILKDIKEFTKNWKAALAEEVSTKNPINFTIIQVGENEASTRYVRNKIKDCEEVGIKTSLIKYPNDISENFLLDEICSEQKYADAIMVQLPLPAHISVKRVAAILDPKKDVDGFAINSLFEPCTAKGIMDYLKYCEFQFTGAHVVVIGRSEIVGKPVAKLLTDADATVTLCHSKTKDIDRFTHAADLIICAVGKEHFLNCYSLYCPIIDVGINFNNEGKLVGDCFNTEDRLVTPVPGGVGLLTRCALLDNIVRCK